jgi:hypothetical protein
MAGIGQNSFRHDTDLLEKMFAARPESLMELVEQTGRDQDDLSAELRALESLGFIELRRGKINYHPPEVAITERARESFVTASAAIGQHLEEAKDLLEALPRLLASWNVGSKRPNDSRTEIFHGPFAATDLWLRVAATRHIRMTDGILPDATRMFTADTDSKQTWFEAIARDDIHVRTILSAHDVTSPGAAEVISEDMAVGAEFRMLPNPPSWLWIANNDMVGLPFRWGDPWPTSVFATDDPAVVTLVRWLYDNLWNEATSLVAETKTWDPLLALMSQGATLEAASRSLGISPRTGRRRIAEALDHYKVDGLFALGAAWQRAQTDS